MSIYTCEEAHIISNDGFGTKDFFVLDIMSLDLHLDPKLDLFSSSILEAAFRIKDWVILFK